MHSHRTKKPCTITAESAVPFYGILKNYEWVDGYLLSVELQNDLSRLESERTALKGLKSSKKSFLEELRQSHAAYQRRREDAIARFLADHWGPDPLRTLEGYAEMKHIPAYFSWEELERSVAQLPDDGIDEPERAVKLKKIEGKIGDMKAELTIVSPSNFFMRGSAKIVCDIRQEFVDFWSDLQRSLSGPATPRGFRLEMAEKPEQDAWSRLGLKSEVNPESHICPNPG